MYRPRHAASCAARWKSMESLIVACGRVHMRLDETRERIQKSVDEAAALVAVQQRKGTFAAYHEQFGKRETHGVRELLKLEAGGMGDLRAQELLKQTLSRRFARLADDVEKLQEKEEKLEKDHLLAQHRLQDAASREGGALKGFAATRPAHPFLCFMKDSGMRWISNTSQVVPKFLGADAAHHRKMKATAVYSVHLRRHNIVHAMKGMKEDQKDVFRAVAVASERAIHEKLAELLEESYSPLPEHGALVASLESKVGMQASLQ